MLLEQVINIIERFAPTNLAESWDNIGLQIGNRKQMIKKVLLALDVTTEVAEQAIFGNYDLIIAHHPLIFSPLKNINEDTVLNRVITHLIKADISLYVAHTNLDITLGGVNDCFAELLGLENCQVLHPTNHDEIYKLAVYVPEKYSEQVTTALVAAGAGQQGKYSDCFFKTKGIGSFRPLENANPFIGSLGELALVDEVKLETVVQKKVLPQVLAAMQNTHPYEVVAYDLYPLTNEQNIRGFGRIGDLPTSMTFPELVQMVKKRFSLKKVTTAFTKNEVRKIALCGGSGSSFIPDALQQKADVLITGDVKYHEAQQALYSGMNIIDITHQASEIIVLPKLQKLLSQKNLIVDIAIEQELLKMV